jgi:hypothetical protein
MAQMGRDRKFNLKHYQKSRSLQKSGNRSNNKNNRGFPSLTPRVQIGRSDKRRRRYLRKNFLGYTQGMNFGLEESDDQKKLSQALAQKLFRLFLNP